MFRKRQLAKLTSMDNWVFIESREWELPIIEGYYLQESPGVLLKPDRLFEHYDMMFVSWPTVLKWAEEKAPKELFLELRTAFDAFEMRCWDEHDVDVERERKELVEDSQPVRIPKPGDCSEADWLEIQAELDRELDRRQQLYPIKYGFE